MRTAYLFFFLMLFQTTFAQTYLLKGRVVDANKTPLKGAAVYVNNTTFGVFTNKNGFYELEISKGKHTVVTSFLGFETVYEQITISKIVSNLHIVLHPKLNVLDEVVIKKVVYDKEWYHNLAVFKRNFLGRTSLSKTCKILNPKVLSFDFNPKTGVLTAHAKKLLQIENKGLGYLITYDLKQFVIHKNRITYLGLSRYENLKGSRRKQKRWKKNRLKAYNGSSTHFYKTLINNSTYKEGFIVHQFKRIPNPDRPTEEEIKKARKLVGSTKTSFNFSKKTDAPKTAIDSALLVLRKVRLPKFQDYLYKSKVPIKDITSVKSGYLYLDFKDNLSVIYTKEKEEKEYITRNVFSKMRVPLAQTSSLIPLQIPTMIDEFGFLLNPLDVFYEGYWSYKKFADTLPINYQPPKEN